MNILNSFKSKESTKKVIARIHSEFDNAGDILLAEAQEILGKTSDNERATRLSKLGFTSALPVIESKKEQELRAAKKAIIEGVEYFRIYYPNNKFITEEMVESICKKYNLLCGEIGMYIGDVPLKNIAEMEAFSLRQEDMGLYNFSNQRGFMQQQNALRNIQNARIDIFGQSRPMYESSYLAQQYAETSHEVTYYKPPFKICAPEKDFQLHGNRKYGYKLIPDPIVLQPVKGGYLIITKWGLEGNDELAINEGSN